MGRDFSVRSHVQNSCGFCPVMHTYWVICREQCRRDVKLTTYLHLLSGLKMQGVSFPLLFSAARRVLATVSDVAVRCSNTIVADLIPFRAWLFFPLCVAFCMYGPYCEPIHRIGSSTKCVEGFTVAELTANWNRSKWCNVGFLSTRAACNLLMFLCDPRTFL